MVAATAGWQKASKRTGSRKVSDSKLAKDIVASIRGHAEVGVMRTAMDYTSRIELIAMVEELLGK